MNKERTYEANLPLEAIKSWLYSRKQINDEKLNEQIADIKERGVVQPIMVRKSDKDFQGLAGYLRYVASQKCGFSTIPAIVYEDINDLDATDILMIENLHRQELSDLDEANILNIYIKEGFKQQDIADRLHVSQPYVSLKLKLLEDRQPLREAISKGAVTEQQARIVRALPTEKAIKEALPKIEGKTIRQTRDIVTETLGKYRKDELKVQIADLDTKIKAIDGYEKERDNLQQDIDKLKGELTALKTDDKTINRNIKKIMELERKYFPALEEITKLKTQINDLDKTFPKNASEFISKLTKERKEVYGRQAKVKVDIDKLNEQLKDLRKQYKDYQEQASTLTQQVNQIKAQQKDMDNAKNRLEKLTEQIRAFEKSHKSAIENFEKLKTEVEASNKELLDKRTEIANKIATLSQQKMVLNGKIANRKNYLEAKKVLERKLKSLK